MARLRRLLIATALITAVLVGCADIPPQAAGQPVGDPTQRPTEHPVPNEHPVPTEPSPPPTPAEKPPNAAPVLRTFPARLPNGKPPLFVVVSFDGAGDLALWSRWRATAKQATARMTFFLSGPYLYPRANRKDYRPPSLKPGASDIGWSDPGSIVRRAAVLRQAIAEGHEIGTHGNGHFCGERGVNRWSAVQWKAELKAFDHMVRTGPTLAAGKETAAPFDPTTVMGMRTPCLEGNRAAYRQAMRERGMQYDASEPGTIRWPEKSDGLWNFPLQSVKLAGTSRTTLTMDYNIWYAQTKARKVPAAQAPRLKAQVVATYRLALARSRAAGNPPLFLGNHFNRWNHSVYFDALEAFVRETCTKPDVRCVTNAELVAWLNKNGTPEVARGQSRR